MNGQALVKWLDPMVAGMAAVHNGDNTGYFQHADWLGSSRLAATGRGTVPYDRAYAPFGEPYVETGTTDRSFTGQTQDTMVGLYDFLFRQYAFSEGRWLVPDPAGLAAVDLTNPQTWNRYAYVGNNPLSNIDPLGLYLMVCPQDGPRGNCPVGGYSDAGAPNMLESLSWSGQVGYNDPFNDNMWVSQDVSGLYTISVNVSGTFGKFKLNNAPNNCPAGPANVYNFIHTNQAAANSLSQQSGVPADYLLGLSGWESQWGANRFAQQGNNFFSLHGGSSAPFANGSMKASVATRTGSEKSEHANTLLPIRRFSPPPTLVVRIQESPTANAWRSQSEHNAKANLTSASGSRSDFNPLVLDPTSSRPALTGWKISDQLGFGERRDILRSEA